MIDFTGNDFIGNKLDCFENIQLVKDTLLAREFRTFYNQLPFVEYDNNIAVLELDKTVIII